MTLQEIYDMAVAGLAGQGFERAVKMDPHTKQPVCQYRGDGGRRCAIGYCIPDDDYNEGMEGRPADDLRILQVLGTSSRPSHRDAIYALQQCHDASRTPEGMRARLRAFGETRGLVIPAVIA